MNSDCSEWNWRQALGHVIVQITAQPGTPPALAISLRSHAGRSPTPVPCVRFIEYSDVEPESISDRGVYKGMNTTLLTVQLETSTATSTPPQTDLDANPAIDARPERSAFATRTTCIGG